MLKNFEILNVGSKLTFVNSRRRKVIDITSGITYLSANVCKYNVSDDESCSDHSYNKLQIGGPHD